MDYATRPAGRPRRSMARGATTGARLPAVRRRRRRSATAYAGFAQRHFGQQVDPEQVLPTVDVTAGVRVALDVLSDRGRWCCRRRPTARSSGSIPVAGRELWELPVDPDAEAVELDLDRLDDLFARGARTLLLTQPHNPLGHVYTRAELEGIRDVAVRHGARVISDEIHAPLVLPGAEHVPYLSLDGTADHAVAVSPPARRSTPPACAAPRSSPPTPPPATGCWTCRWRATTRGRRSARWRDRGVHRGRRLAGRAGGAARPAARRCSASCWPSTCPRPGCARSRRPTSPGSTCAPTATTTRPRWRSTRGGCSSSAGHRYQPGLRRPRPAQHRHLARAAHRDRAPAGRRTDLMLSWVCPSAERGTGMSGMVLRAWLGTRRSTRRCGDEGATGAVIGERCC